MTRKNYNELAAAIHTSNAEAAASRDKKTSIAIQDSNLMLALKIASICKQENPRFDEDRFMLACGFAMNTAKKAV